MKPLMRFGVVLLGVLAACGGGGGGGSYQPPASASPGPTLAVERFLQAANVNDLETMTQLFGTRDKTIVELDGRQQAEERMYLLASLLRHDDFVIQGQRIVPGRRSEATEVIVQLTQGQGTVTVPHLVVRTTRGGWVIEKVDVVALTNR